MALVQRGKIWWYEFRLNGTRHRGSTHTRNKHQARTIEAQAKARIAAGANFISLQALCDLWLTAKRHKASIRNDETRWENILKHFDPKTTINEISVNDVEDWKAQLLLTYAPATTNRHLALLKSSFNLAKKRSLIRFNPVVVDMCKEQPRLRAVTEDEYQLIINNASGNLKTAVLLAYSTGMRLGEITALTDPQVRLNAPTPHIYLPQTKNGSQRIVPLPQPCVEYLSSIRIAPMNADYISTLFRKLTQSLGLKDLRFHDLRRSFVSKCRLANIPLATTMRLTGHKTAAVIIRHYSVVADDELGEAVSQLSRVKIF